jgi:hypothetical protein
MRPTEIWIQAKSSLEGGGDWSGRWESNPRHSAWQFEVLKKYKDSGVSSSLGEGDYINDLATESL